MAKLSHKARLLAGALAAYIPPKMAADAAPINLRTLVDGVTARTWKDDRSKVVTRLQDALRGKLGKDASLDDVTQLLDRLDKEGTPEEDEEVMSPSAAVAPQQGMTNMDAGAECDKILEYLEDKLHPEHLAAARQMVDDSRRRARDAEMEKMPEADRAKRAKDWETEDAKRGMDRKARDEKRARDKKGRDEETEEEKKKREEREAEDRKRGMDSAIDNALKGERERQSAVREAERAVRPWLGDLATVPEKAEDVYKLALDHLKIDTKDVHPSAFRAILNTQPKPGSKPNATGKQLLAHDGAASSDFNKRFPSAARIRSV